MYRKIMPFADKEKAQMHLIYTNGNGAEEKQMYREKIFQQEVAQPYQHLSTCTDSCVKLDPSLLPDQMQVMQKRINC